VEKTRAASRERIASVNYYVSEKTFYSTHGKKENHNISKNILTMHT